MADRKKTLLEFLDVPPARGPDPEDAWKVEEFAHRSQDARAAPWEALARLGHRADSAIGAPRMWPDPTATEARTYTSDELDALPRVGPFEGWAKAIPGTIGTALAGRTQGGPNTAAFPTGAQSLQRMREEAVLRDIPSTVEPDPAPLGLPSIAGEWAKFARSQRVGAAADRNAQTRAQQSHYGTDTDWRDVNTGSDPTLGPLRSFDLNSTEPIPEPPVEADIPPPVETAALESGALGSGPAENPGYQKLQTERRTLEDFLRKWMP